MKSFEQIFDVSSRSKQVLKNVVLSVLLKSISVIAPLIIVPLTIDYVNPVQYGIWLTVSSLVSWCTVFDFGLGNGLKNKFAESLANDDEKLARQYVSTTYFAITIIVLCLFALILLINSVLDWTTLLKIDGSYRLELQTVIGILSAFLCLSMIVNLFAVILSGNQENWKSSLISGIGQICSLIAIYILTKVSSGSLKNLALYFSGVPCFVMIAASLYFFRFTSYKRFAPSIKYIKTDLIKEVLGLGVQFFIIQLCMIAVFQIVNFVLTREVGPLAVTQYNIAQKYFQILASITVLILAPIWPAFTDAYTRKDALWMKNAVKKLELFFLFLVICGVVMLVVSPFVYKIWIRDSVEIPFALSALMMLYSVVQALGNIYMYMINGTGLIRLQLVIYVIMAIISWPVFTYACRYFGIYGALVIPTLTLLVQVVFGKIQINRIVADKADGIYGK